MKGNEKILLKEGVFIIVISNEEEEETNELETVIVIEFDIQKIKPKQQCLDVSPCKKYLYAKNYLQG